MAELTRATDHWLAEEGQTPLRYTLALVEKQQRVLVMLADSLKLPQRAGDAPPEIADGATVADAGDEVGRKSRCTNARH